MEEGRRAEEERRGVAPNASASSIEWVVSTTVQSRLASRTRSQTCLRFMGSMPYRGEREVEEESCNERRGLEQR